MLLAISGPSVAALAFVAAGCGRFEFDVVGDASGPSDGAPLGDAPSVPPAVVQRVGWSNYASGIAKAIPTSLPGDLLIVAVDINSASDQVAQVTDDVGNTYVSANASSAGPSNPGGAVVSEIWYAMNAASGPIQLTVRTAGTSGFWDVTMLEVSGLATSPVDAVATLNNAPGTTVVANGGAVVTTQPFDVVVVINTESVTPNAIVGGGFTNYRTGANDNVAYALTTTAGTYEASFTCPSPCGAYNVSTVAFKAAYP